MSSLFGNTQSTTKPSLFSTPATSSPFGGLNNTTQPAQQTGSSLFGTLGTASSQPQQGGLFAPKTTQAQTPGSLFGNSTQAPAQSSLFGSTTTTQPQQSSLFGSTTQAPQQTGTSLFGQTATTTQPQQQPGSSLFGATVSTTQPQQPSLFQSTSQGPNQQNGGQSAAYFDTILERSRKRAHADSTSEDLPALQLGLGDLRQRIKRLGTGTPERALDGKAHYLLAASGVDPGAAIRDLNLLTSQATRTERTQTVEPDDTDVEAYLANLETQTTLSMISDGLARSVKDFDTFLEDKMTMEWDAQRKRIYEHFGIKAKEGLDNTRANASFAASASESQGGFGRSRRGKGAALNGSRAAGTPGASTFGRSAMSKSVIGSAAPIGTASQPLFADIEKKVEASPNAVGPSDRFLREKQGKFIAKVQKLNEARIQKTSYPVLAELSSVVGQTGESYTSEVIKAYRAVIEMVGEDPDVVSLGDPRAVKERQFAHAYLDELPGSANSIATKKRILNGSTRFLEKLFFEELEAYVEKNPREANLGGVPNVLSKVKAWIRIKAARKDLTPDNADQLQTVNGDYMWALVFYLLRSGHVKEAVDYVTANAVAFRAIDRNFAAYLTAYYNSPDRRLRRDLQDRMHNEYNQRTRIAPENSLDPFRMCCYKVIGRCDIENRTLNGIIQSMEDYIWLQFVLAREVSKVDETASEVYGLSDVQATIQEIGSKHFTKAGADGSDAFGVYFFLQVLAGLFEPAVEYLYALRHIDAVHFAIALDFYGLLRVSDPNVAESDFLSFTTRGSPQVNFGRMIGYYTRDFRSANSTAAVDYLSLICLNHDLPGDIGRKQVALCHEALRELVLESREFALLVGDIKADGQRIKGVIEERLPLLRLEDEDDFMRTITIQAASVADDNGRTTDAVLLYQLAGEYNNVTVIITRALSEAVAVPIGHDPVHLQPLKPRAPGEKEASSSSLSLATIDEPVALAKAMIGLWAGKRSYLDKIKQENKAACEVLLRMSDAKTLVEQEQWARAMDIIIALDILPLKAGGNPSEIRSYASKFSSLPQTVANNVPNLLMWTLLCCERQRTHLVNGQFGGNEGTRRLMVEDLRQKNVDLATYTSQLRFRLPGSLHDLLAKAVTE